MNRNLFDFAPSSWLPTQDKAVLEYCRNIKREEISVLGHIRDCIVLFNAAN